jgi:hypothetical protein
VFWFSLSPSAFCASLLLYRFLLFASFAKEECATAEDTSVLLGFALKSTTFPPALPFDLTDIILGRL